MRILAATRVAVFAGEGAAGNPAVVVRCADWPVDGAAVQALAGRLGETVAVLPAAAHDPHSIRWFAPAGEIALCGHGALAAGHVLLAGDGACTLQTARGERLGVTRAGDRLAIDLAVRMPAPAPLEAVVAALGCRPVETLAHPDRYAVVVVADAAAVRACRPDRAALEALGDWQVIATACEGDGTIVSRVWSPGGGEDAATGSAHAVIAPWWAARLGRDRLAAVQASLAGGRLHCMVAGDVVRVSGRCMTLADGQAAIAALSVSAIQPPPSTRSPA